MPRSKSYGLANPMLMLALSVIGALLSGLLAFWRRPQAPRFWPLLAIAALPQFMNLAGIRLPWMFFSAIALIGIWCVYNRAVPGTLVVAAGIGLNLLVMAFHGGAMPIRADVLTSLGYAATPGTLLDGSKDIIVHSSALGLLSDWIVLPLASTQVFVSPGDLVIVAGIIWWLLFSHQPEKDRDHAHTLNHTDLARTAHAPVTGTE